MIDRLQMFLTLAQERHFGRAAAVCGVTQPSLSSAIRQLEDQLGVQLVFRGSRFQGLTPEGERALDWARRITADARALRDEMRSARAGLSGTLRLGVIPTALPMVADLTGPFALKHQEVQIVIRSHTSDEILAGLVDLTLDAGITYLDEAPPRRPDGAAQDHAASVPRRSSVPGRLAQVPLYIETYRFLCAAGSTFADRAEVSWAEAAGQPLCLLTPDMQNRRIVDRHLAGAGGTQVPRITSNSSLALVAHVATGHWASVVPAVLAALFTARGDLRAVALGGPQAGHAVGLAALRRAPMTPLVAALMTQAERTPG